MHVLQPTIFVTSAILLANVQECRCDDTCPKFFHTSFMDFQCWSIFHTLADYSFLCPWFFVCQLVLIGTWLHSLGILMGSICYH